MAPQSCAFGPFALNIRCGSLLRDGRPVAIGTKGLTLLSTLLQTPGEVVNKSALIEAAWGSAIVEESNLTVQIAALRKLLGPQPDGSDWIATVPRIGYRFNGSARFIDPSVDRVKVHDDRAREHTEKSSIVVLPLANNSGDKEQEYLADGITDDIITALTRFRWFRVTGRSSSFVYKGKSVSSKQIAEELRVRYVLEGSVRRSGQQVRISVQLVDAASASQIWAERYDMELTEAFAIQDAIAERVVGALEPELLKTESLPAGAPHSGNVTAWDLVRQGTWQFHQVSRESHLKARELFRQACGLDPELAEAHIWLGRVSAGIVAYGWSAHPAKDTKEGLDAALKAIRVDERNPYSHYALAICSAFANAPEQAVLAAEKSIEISPSFALGHLVLGMGYLFRGSATDAIAPLERGLTLNPNDPQNFVWFNLLALAHLFTGSPDKALAAAVKSRKVRPAWRPIYETLTFCYAALGQPQEAKACVVRLNELEKPSGDALEPLRMRNPNWAAQMAAWLNSGV